MARNDGIRREDLSSQVLGNEYRLCNEGKSVFSLERGTKQIHYLFGYW